jgi:hypothetical protein
MYSNVEADFSLGVKNTSPSVLTADQYDDINNLPGVEKVYKYRKTAAEILVPVNTANPGFIYIHPKPCMRSLQVPMNFGMLPLC